MKKKVLLISPPFTQLNTPYPAICYLKGFLDTQNIDSYQSDLSLEVILEIFSRKGLEQLFASVAPDGVMSENAARIYALRGEYIEVVDTVIEFLQGGAQSMAQLLADDSFLPRASKFDQLADLEWAFGAMGFRDKARHYCTLFLEDISDFIIETTDSEFGFSRYAEHLGRCAGSFDEIEQALQKPLSYVEQILIRLLDEKMRQYAPHLVALSIPFPGNLLCGLRCGQFLRQNYPQVKIEMGGGFANTELRSLTDGRIFQYVDYITLDDGERPLLQIVRSLDDDVQLSRTYIYKDNKVCYINNEEISDFHFSETGTPDYSDLFLDKYLSVIEMANPMHKLWSDGRWNKLTFAHGCYWGKCAFCDGALDYIRRYEPVSASLIVDRMEQQIAQTGERGFHFVDEAAPPMLMKEVALEILRRGMRVSWWTNVRFEKSFTADLCRLLKQSGCLAVSGGLEVASDRLLKLINKGVTVDQVAKVASNFTQAGIMVHAYLMYGFPTETMQETIDSLEVVRQLFAQEVVQSGFWHRFAMTAHSPVGRNPEKYQVKPQPSQFKGFADNDRFFDDPVGASHELFGDGLRKSLFNYMHGIGLELPLTEWFDFRVPHTTVSPRRIQLAISRNADYADLLERHLCWIGGKPELVRLECHRKGKVQAAGMLRIHNRTDFVEVELPYEVAAQIYDMILTVRYDCSKLTLSDLEKRLGAFLTVNFEKFVASEPMQDLLSTGLLLL